MATSETATLGGGCFWCLEAVYDEMQGVLSVDDLVMRYGQNEIFVESVEH